MARFTYARTVLSTTAAAFASAALALALAGCADTITYSSTERQMGQVYLQEGDHASAAGIFSNQVRRNPKDYRAHYHLGESRMALGRYGEAIRSFRSGLDVLPLTPRGANDAEYRGLLVEGLSTALAAHDEDGTQLAQLEDVSQHNKDRKLVVAMTHAKAGRPDPALAAFREAANMDRSDPLIAKHFGLYLEHLNQPVAAEEVLRRAYALNSSDEEVAAALLRLGVVPGPSLISRNHLARPPLPVGPLPEVKLTGEQQRPANPNQGTATGDSDGAPQPTGRSAQDPTLN